MTERRGPSLGETCSLLLRLRFLLFARRVGGRGWLGTLVSGLPACVLAGGLGVGAAWVFSSVDAIASHPVWMAFSLGLFTFLLGLFWVLWPVVAAQVDEAYEMGRFFQFPVRPVRLYAIQTLVGVVEPSVLFFYPILIGALVGLSSSLEPDWTAAVALTIAFVAMCVATGRCLLNLFLNIMTSRRSGEILFALFLLLLGLAALLPPVDASWLFERLGDFGASDEDLSLLANTARALGATPPGFFARGLAAAAGGCTEGVVSAVAMMIACAGAAWMLGLWLLLRFYRGSRGLGLLPKRRLAKGRPPAQGRGWALPFGSERVAAVFEKELRTLMSNPKGRMLFAVPFFLLIILKVVGAGQLFFYLWSEAWAAVLWSLLGFYVLSILGGQLLVNGFGYDGYGVHWPFWQPAPLRNWLVGRNLAQAVFACTQMVGLGVLLFALVPGAGARLLCLPLTSFALGLLVLLGLGNLLSIRYPRRFHFSLARRDRPVAAAFLWVLTTLGGCTLLSLAALGLAAFGPAVGHLALFGLPALGFVVYRLVLPLAERKMRLEREALIATLTR